MCYLLDEMSEIKNYVILVMNMVLILSDLFSNYGQKTWEYHIDDFFTSVKFFYIGQVVYAIWIFLKFRGDPFSTFSTHSYASFFL